MKLEIDLGNLCTHGCIHCLYEGGTKGKRIDKNKFEHVLKLYSSKIKYFKEVLFTGGELFDIEDFPFYIRNFAKKGVKRISFVTRGGVYLNKKTIDELLKIKEEFPNLEFNITLSIDRFSKEYNKNKDLQKHNAKEITNLFLELGKNRIFIKSVIPTEGEGFIKNHKESNLDVLNSIILYLKNEKNATLIGTRNNKQNNIYVYTFLINGREVEIFFKYSELYSVNNPDKKLKGSIPGEKVGCNLFSLSSFFTIFLDPEFNLLFCSEDLHLDNKSRHLINLLDSDRQKVIESIIFTKLRFYKTMGYEDIIDYILNPSNLICNNFIKELNFNKENNE